MIEIYQRILIPTDGSTCSEHALQQGVELAARLGAAVTLLYVVEDPLYYARNALAAYGDLYDDLRRAGREILEAAGARAQEAGVPFETILIDTPATHPVEAILQAEAHHDLTVIATHGRRGFSRMMLGSVAEGVVRRSSNPQLVIRCPTE